MKTSTFLAVVSLAVAASAAPTQQARDLLDVPILAGNGHNANRDPQSGNFASNVASEQAKAGNDADSNSGWGRRRRSVQLGRRHEGDHSTAGVLNSALAGADVNVGGVSQAKRDYGDSAVSGVLNQLLAGLTANVGGVSQSKRWNEDDSYDGHYDDTAVSGVLNQLLAGLDLNIGGVSQAKRDTSTGGLLNDLLAGLDANVGGVATSKTKRHLDGDSSTSGLLNDLLAGLDANVGGVSQAKRDLLGDLLDDPLIDVALLSNNGHNVNKSPQSGNAVSDVASDQGKSGNSVNSGKRDLIGLDVLSDNGHNINRSPQSGNIASNVADDQGKSGNKIVTGKDDDCDEDGKPRWV